MRHIDGYDVVGFDLNSLSLVADLIYFDGPLLSHYVSPQGDNYLFYWVDSDEECNRWMIIKINLQIIQDYVSHKVTLLSVIKERADKSVYIVDFNDDLEVQKCCFVNIDDLDNAYFPKGNSYYKFEPREACDLYVLSKKYNQGVFELRITGEGVSYGTMPLEKLSTIISSFEGIRKNIAADFIKNKKLAIDKERQRCKFITQTQETKAKIESLRAQEASLKLDTSYNTIYSAAGSFRILFMPKNLQLNLWQETSMADEFANEVVSFIGAGEEIDILREFARKYSSGLVKKLEDFVVGINKNRLNIELKWYDDNTQNKVSYEIPHKRTNNIIHNLSTFEYDNVEEISMIGKFYAINLRSNKYSFEDDFGNSSGNFSNQISAGAHTINFNKIYCVKIQRRTLQAVGKKEKIKDILVSFIESIDKNEV